MKRSFALWLLVITAVLLGLSILLMAGPVDTDGDGFFDDVDECVTDPGTAPEGCPDTDGDGFKDRVDRCPQVAGVAPDGCPPPDRDGDGILDADDRDGDGILDADDKCIDVKETMNHYQDDDGCPDEIPKGVQSISGVPAERFPQLGTIDEAGSAADPLFPYTRNEALATVVLRDDHAKRACRSPKEFLGALKTAINSTSPGVKKCQASVVNSTPESGVSLTYHCQLKKERRGSCVEYFEGNVWLELTHEEGPKPSYVMTFSLLGTSRGYRKCSRNPGSLSFVNEEAVRELKGGPRDERRSGDSVFELQAEECG